MKDNDSFVCYPTERMGYAPGGIAIEPKTNPDLPKGCKPIECRKPPIQRLMEVHFVGDEIKRAFHIMEAFKLPAGCLVPIKAKTSIEECSLVLSEDIVSQLTEVEQGRAKVFVPPAQLLYEPPVLYRFIGKKWVDKFFEVGELQISTFQRCKTKEVDDRSDTGEGLCTFVGIIDNKTVETVVGTKGNPLMLCFSLGVNARHKKDDGCIVIHDINALVVAITEALVKAGFSVARVMHGPCTYSQRLVVKRTLGRNEVVSQLVDDVSVNQKSFDLDVVLNLAAQVGGVRNYFTKPPSFCDEQEYRIVWDCTNECKEDSVKVNLDKDVVKRCCDRIDMDELPHS